MKSRISPIKFPPGSNPRLWPPHQTFTSADGDHVQLHGKHGELLYAAPEDPTTEPQAKTPPLALPRHPPHDPSPPPDPEDSDILLVIVLIFFGFILLAMIFGVPPR